MEELDNKAKRLLDLQKMLIKFAEVERLIHFPDGKYQDRKENNTEHSYNLAMAAWYLSSFFPHLDKNKLIKYALVHDLVEVHAGDIQAIGRTKEEQDLKEKREKEALVKLRQDWQDFDDLTNHIHDYELRLDSESKFIYALDKIMPMILNLLSEGKTWKQYDFPMEQILKEKDDKTQTSKEVEQIWQAFRAYIIRNKNTLFK